MDARLTAGCVIGIDASRAIGSIRTGTEAYAYHLIRSLVPRLLPRHNVRLYYRTRPVTGDDTFLAPVDGVEERVMPFPRLWTHARLSWEMVRHPPDLLFVPSHVLPLLRPRRTLVTIHDLGYRKFPKSHPASQRMYLEISTRWNARVASHILADSAATRDDIVEAYGVSPDKITVVYPGYSRELAPVRDPETLSTISERYAIPGPYILFIGRIQPRKNLVRLIEAFDRIVGDHPELTLVLAGPTGWMSAPIEARVRELGLERRVRFPGYVAAEDKAGLISRAELVAYPSRHEGFGFPVLEAQVCGTPVLTSATSSLPEVAGEGALLVDPRDVEAIAEGMARLLDDPELKRKLVSDGYENLTRFSWAQAARQVEQIIEELLTA
jgi:glycosyltransferase involved in cell wall biosynthesis